jgi:hypothetical protein
MRSDIITVKGAFIVKVVSNHRLLQTHTTYQESEWAAHITNLKTIMLYAKFGIRINMCDYWKEVVTPEFADALYGSRWRLMQAC